MNCFRFSLRKKFIPYLEGQLSPREEERLKTHLLNCERCRGLFVRLRTGHQFAKHLSRPSAESATRPPEFESIMADLADATSWRRRTRVWESWHDVLTSPRAVRVLTVLVLVQLALLVVTNWKVLFAERHRAAFQAGAFDFSNFQPLQISDIERNTYPRIATEGYVRDVHVDPEERTVHFKLVDIPKGSGTYVTCEIMSLMGVPVPREGSRVRVYGITRYDAQANRNWQEVNPVLSIAVLKN
jgi:hypothetical protein